MAIVPSTANSHYVITNEDNSNPNTTNQRPVLSTSGPTITDGAADGTQSTPTPAPPPTTTIAVQWNLRGLTARTNELQQLLEQHHSVVVALQEIKTKKRNDKDKLDRRYDWQFCFKPSSVSTKMCRIASSTYVVHSR